MAAIERFVSETGIKALLEGTASSMCGFLAIGDSVSNPGRVASLYHTIRRTWPQMGDCIAIGCPLAVADYSASLKLGLHNGFSSPGAGTVTDRYSNGALVASGPDADDEFDTGDYGVGAGITRDIYSTGTSAYDQIYAPRMFADTDTTQRANFTNNINPRFRFGWFHSAIGGQAPAGNIKYRLSIYNGVSGSFVSNPAGTFATLAISKSGGIDIHDILPSESLSANQTVGIRVGAEFTASGQHAYLSTLRIEDPSATTGFALTFCGEGGHRYNSHLDIGDSDADTTVRPLLQDDCLADFVTLHRFPEVVMIHCYNGYTEWSNTAKFTRVIEKIIARFETAYRAAGESEGPKFLLVSPIPSVDLNMQQSHADQMAAIMEAVALAGVTTAHTAPANLEDPENAGFYCTVPGGAAGRIAFINARLAAIKYGTSEYITAAGEFEGDLFVDSIHLTADGNDELGDVILRQGVIANAPIATTRPGRFVAAVVKRRARVR